MEYFTSVFSQFLLSVKTIFRKRTGQKWMTLAIGWVLQAGARTTAGLIRAAGEMANKTYSSYYRFFLTKSWNPDDFWKKIQEIIIKKVCTQEGKIYLAVDDTLWQKVGRTIEGTGWFPDKKGMYHKKMTYVFGQCWVVLSVVIKNPFGINKTFSLPVMARLYRKKVDCKKKGEEFRTRLELLGEMIEKIALWWPNRPFLLLADRLYGGRPAIGDLPENVEAIVRIKKDARIYEQPTRPENPGPGRPRKRGKQLPQPEDWKQRYESFNQTELVRYGSKAEVYITSRKCLWYWVTGEAVGRVVLIVDRENPDRWAAFYCTDPNLSAQRVPVTYSLRWSIEVLFRQAKQFGGVEDPQCRKKNAVRRQTPFNLGLVTLVKSWFLLEGREKTDLTRDDWEETNAPISFQMMLQALRWQIRREQFIKKVGPPPNSEKTFEEWRETLKELFNSWARAA